MEKIVTNVKQQRNSSIELLRFILMCFIFCGHILVHGYDFKNLGLEGFTYDGNIIIALILNSLFSSAVYCFVFISGYYGIKFSKDKLFQYLFWCIIIALSISLIQRYWLGMPVTLKTIVYSFFPVSTYRWWYMTEFILLFVLSLILNAGIVAVNKKQCLFILLLLFVYLALTMLKGYHSLGSNLLGVISIYLLGRYFVLYKMKVSLHYACITYIGCLLALFFCLLASYNFLPDNRRYVIVLLGYNNPFIIGMAGSLFFLIHGLPAFSSKWVNKLLVPNLFVYLITEGWGYSLYKLIGTALESHFVYGIFLSFVVVVVSLLVGRIVINFSNICLKWVI